MERGPYLRFAWRVPAGVRVVPNYGSPALGHAEGKRAPFPNPELQPAEQARQIDAAHQALRPSWLDLSDEGLAGYVAAFEPGFGTGSYYFDQVPLPMNFLPYCLTGFVYREVTWDPGLTLDELKQRILRRYFSPDAPERFVDDMI